MKTFLAKLAPLRLLYRRGSGCSPSPFLFGRGGRQWLASGWPMRPAGSRNTVSMYSSFIFLPVGPNIQALVGGSLDVRAPGISGVVLAAARGAPVRLER